MATIADPAPDEGVPAASRTLVLHLVSHASGELVEMMARNAIAQFEDLQVERRLWKMVRRLGQVPEILAALAESPGLTTTCCAPLLSGLLGILAGATGAGLLGVVRAVSAVAAALALGCVGAALGVVGALAAGLAGAVWASVGTGADCFRDGGSNNIV